MMQKAGGLNRAGFQNFQGLQTNMINEKRKGIEECIEAIPGQLLSLFCDGRLRDVTRACHKGGGGLSAGVFKWKGFPSGLF